MKDSNGRKTKWINGWTVNECQRGMVSSPAEMGKWRCMEPSKETHEERGKGEFPGEMHK